LPVWKQDNCKYTEQDEKYQSNQSVAVIYYEQLELLKENCYS